MAAGYEPTGAIPVPPAPAPAWTPQPAAQYMPEMTGQIPAPAAYPQAGYAQAGYQQPGYPQQQQGFTPGYQGAPYGAQTYGAPVYRGPSPMAGVMAKVAGGNPLGAILTGVTAVLVAFVLALITALVANASILTQAMKGEGITGAGVRSLLGWLMTSILGARTSFTDTLSSRSYNGAGIYSITVGAVPLGFTILTLAITILVWRRATARHASAVAVVIDAVIAAVVAAVIMLIVAIATNSTLSSRYGGLITGDSGETAKVGPSAAGAFFVTLLVLLVVLLLAGLAGRNFFPAKAAAVAQAISAGLKGFFAFAIAIPVLGLIIGLIVSSVSIDGASLFDLASLGQFTGTLVVAIVAFSGNIGLWAASLGSFGNVQLVGNGGTQPYSMSDLADPNMVGGAIWAAIVVPIVALLIGAVVASRGNQTRNIALGAFGAYCVSLLALVPILGSFANFHGVESLSGSFADQCSQYGNYSYGCNTPFYDMLNFFGLPTSYSGNSVSISAGAGLVGATFLLFLFALVISFIVALATGVITTSQLGAAQGRAMQALNVTLGAPQGYGYPQQPAYGYQPQPEAWTPQGVPQPVPQPMPQMVPQPVPQPMPQPIFAPQPAPQPAARFQEVPPPPPEDEAIDTTIFAPLSATLPPPPPPEEAVFACPACGTPQPAGAKFCDKCGTPLGYQAG